MDSDLNLAELKTLNQISATLNEAVDLDSALRSSLQQLVKVLGLTTGWIFMLDQATPAEPTSLVPCVYYQLPPALGAEDAAALQWEGCACQKLFNAGKLHKAVNIVECSRIEDELEQGHDVGGLRLHASVPIRGRDRVIGILNVASPTTHHFSDEQLQLMTVVGNQIGLAAERARLYDLTRAQRVNELSALLKLSNALLTSEDLQAIVNQVVQVVAEVLGADSCALILGRENDELDFRASIGWDLSEFTDIRPHFVPYGPGGMAYFTGQLIQVDDLETDPRFPSPELLLRRSGFRSILAVPVLHGGQVIGVLTVQHRTQRHFDDQEARLLQLMANQTAIAIERARLQEQALAEQRLRKELELARQIQTAFLPSQLPILEGWEFGRYYATAREVGGDYYDFINIRDPSERPPSRQGRYLDGCGLLGLLIADVSDKGVPAALYMALSRTLVRAVTINGRSPAEAIARVNELLLQDSHTDQFVTLFYGVLDPAKAHLCFVNAGHNPPLLVRGQTGAVLSLHTPGSALGIFPTVQLTESEIYFQPGDIVFLYTDGVTETINTNLEEFGAERLARALVENRHHSAEEIVQKIATAVREFGEDREAFDDITMVAVKRV